MHRYAIRNHFNIHECHIMYIHPIDIHAHMYMHAHPTKKIRLIKIKHIYMRACEQ